MSEYLGQSEINVLQEAEPFVVSEYLDHCIFNNIKILKFLADCILFNTKLISFIKILFYFQSIF